MNRLSRILLTLTLGVPTLAQAQQAADTLSLSDAIAKTLDNSPTVTQALAAVDAARARVGQAEASTQPQLSADASYTRVDPTVTVTFPINGKPTDFSFSPNDVYSGALTLQQSILDFGRARSQRNLAEAGVQSANDRVELAKELAAFQTIQSYYAILTIDQNVKIEQDQITVLQQALDVAETREKAGSATTLDPLNIQVRISSLQNHVSSLNAARTKQVAVLRRLTGLPTDRRIVVKDVPSRIPASIGLDSLASLADLQRLEVAAAKDEENTAKLAIDAAQASDNPSVGLNITGGVKDGYPPELTKPTLNWAGSVGLRVPILDGGRTKSLVDEAEANYRAAQARTLDAERGVRSDVEQALADLQSIDEQRHLISTQLRQAREALDITQLRYKNGAATNLDVLTAQSNLEESMLQESQLNYQYALSEYTLERAIGNRLY